MSFDHAIAMSNMTDISKREINFNDPFKINVHGHVQMREGGPGALENLDISLTTSHSCNLKAIKCPWEGIKTLKTRKYVDINF